MRASSAIVDIQPDPTGTHDTYVRERSRYDSRLCSQCGREHMHRAHRHSTVDFVVSLVGIFPTVCGYCHARGQRLEPLRLVLLLAAAMLALGSYIAHGLWLDKSASAQVTVLHGSAHPSGPALSQRAPLDQW